MKTFLIITSPIEQSDSMIELIKSLFPTFSFWNNHFLISSDRTAKDIYNSITNRGVDKKSVLITEINSTVEDGYWGVMPKELWEWLRNV